MERALTALAATVAAILSGCVETTLSESYRFDGPIDRVVVEVDAGDVELRANDGKGGLVDVELSCRTAVPPVDVFLDGTTLHVILDAGNGASACDGAFEIAVPGQADADLRTGSGDIAVEAVDGDLEALTYDGDIFLKDLAGAMDLTAVSGDVTATGLESTDCTIAAGAGRVEATFESVPTSVDVEIANGNAVLKVPSSTYRIEAEVEDGQVEVSGLVEQPAADSEIWVAVATGDINITGE